MRKHLDHTVDCFGTIVKIIGLGESSWSTYDGKLSRPTPTRCIWRINSLQAVCKSIKVNFRPTPLQNRETVCACAPGKRGLASAYLSQKLLVIYILKLLIRELGPTGRKVLRLEYYGFSVMVAHQSPKLLVRVQVF